MRDLASFFHLTFLKIEHVLVLDWRLDVMSQNLKDMDEKMNVVMIV